MSLLFLIPFLISAQPKEEVRAVWLTTVFNLDWPTTSGETNQKNEMRNLLNLLQGANFNTIMLQVRARGDLLYPSGIEPWAKSITGNLGQNPGWDPLLFILDEAHQRGIEVHAWWNVYKVYGTGIPPNTNPQHVVLSHPELCRTYADEWWMDPGIPGTKTYLLNLAIEMIRKYDIDAIHFDFIRYPNPDFDDADTYVLYGQGVNKSDWRRNNISQFVYALYDSVQAIKPRIKVGSAPIGIYQDLSQCLSGWDSYSNTFQDSRRWLLANKHDYHSPQIYWGINTCPRFDSLAMNWIANSNGKHIYPGIAVYRMSPPDNWPASEIIAQIDSSRIYGGEGQTFFRTASFTSNQNNIYQLVRNGVYQYPANIPPMLWKDNIKPNSPSLLTLTTIDSLTFTLGWDKPLPASDGDTAIYYNVYQDNSFPVDISDIKKVIKFRIAGDTSTTITLTSVPNENKYFAITAYDKGYNESLPAEVALIVNYINEAISLNGYELMQNFPNPFNPSTVIKYTLAYPGNTSIKVYDLLGNEIAVLINEFQNAGSHEVIFSVDNLPLFNNKLTSGIYFYTIRSNAYFATKKMLLIR